MRVVFTPLAERQVDRLHAYISEKSSADRADRYVGRIVDFCVRLKTYPLRGTKRDDNREETSYDRLREKGDDSFHANG
jgi:toxin ParE1/3/4